MLVFLSGLELEKGAGMGPSISLHFHSLPLKTEINSKKAYINQNWK